MKTISLIIPIFNEAENISDFIEAFQGIKTPELNRKYNFELFFINDGSTDGTSKILREKTANEASYKLIEFSKNFGKELATTAGLHHCTGDAAIMIDADLQHPIELIPEFIQKWEKGAKVIIGIRDESKKKKWIKKIGAYCFYKIINTISETEILANSTDFRLIDRMVIDEFEKFTEKNRMTRGLIDWMGFKRDYINFKANPRRKGDDQYSTRKLLKLAFASFVSLSLFPLKLAGYLGITTTLCSSILGVFILIEKHLLQDPLNLKISGTASLAIFILFLVGIILSSLGLMALYIANIHQEVINRPIYIIENKKNIK